jgi:histidine triad (HIT) family protein
MECVFCKIINNEIKSEKVYEDEDLIGIRDINPQAPVHILIIPRKHFEKLHQIEETCKRKSCRRRNNTNVRFN